MSKCKHGMEESWCGLCKGFVRPDKTCTHVLIEPGTRVVNPDLHTTFIEHLRLHGHLEVYQKHYMRVRFRPLPISTVVPKELHIVSFGDGWDVINSTAFGEELLERYGFTI